LRYFATSAADSRPTHFAAPHLIGFGHEVRHQTLVAASIFDGFAKRRLSLAVLPRQRRSHQFRLTLKFHLLPPTSYAFYSSLLQAGVLDRVETRNAAAIIPRLARRSRYATPRRRSFFELMRDVDHAAPRRTRKVRYFIAGEFRRVGTGGWLPLPIDASRHLLSPDR